jgi:hypothetical protein
LEHDKHQSKTGIKGDAKKHGNGGKGTWGSIEGDIKEAMEEHKA